MSRSGYSRGPRLITTYRTFYILLFIIILFGLALTALLQFWPHKIELGDELVHLNSPSLILEARDEVTVHKDSPGAAARDVSCTFHSCFDVYHCGYNDDSRISIYIYPFVKYIDEKGIPLTLPLSKEYITIVRTIMGSVYYETDPDKACLFLPPIDFLNQNTLRLAETSQILAALPRFVWNSTLLSSNIIHHYAKVWLDCSNYF